MNSEQFYCTCSHRTETGRIQFLDYSLKELDSYLCTALYCGYSRIVVVIKSNSTTTDSTTTKPDKAKLWNAVYDTNEGNDTVRYSVPVSLASTAKQVKQLLTYSTVQPCSVSKVKYS